MQMRHRTSPNPPFVLVDAELVSVTVQSLEALAEGNTVYLNASSLIGQALASASGTMEAIGVVPGGVASGRVGEVVVQGPVHSTNINASGRVGKNAYVSVSSAGAIQTAAPSASGQIVQKIGTFIDGSGIFVAVSAAFQRGGSL